ncbi:MAG: TetR/AcrR family transcriptional regulator [Mycobacterium sp.]|nr:TetR/AcrR family transcriptional regulator [Mycobacterium sp.]
MVRSAAAVLRERGAAGVTIDEVLARSGAPRGSVYHHFPEGRSQLLIEALRFAGDSMTTHIDGSAAYGGIALVRGFVSFWDHVLADSDFTAGCPVVAAAVGSADEAPTLAPIAAEIFDRWRVALGRAFAAEGFDPADASALAVTSLAALEGAVVMCRSARDIGPLHDVAAHLEFLIKAKAFVKNNGMPTAGG